MPAGEAVRIAVVWRALLLAPVLVILLMLPVLYIYGDRLIIVVLDRYLASNALQLQRGELQIDWQDGTISGSQLALVHLADQQPIVTVGSLNGQLSLLDLLEADNGQTSVVASQVAVFMSSGEEAETSGGWLVYRNWLPGLVDIDQLLLHSPASEAVPPSALLQLQGRAGKQPGSYDIMASAEHAGDHLSASASLHSVESLGEDRYGLHMSFQVSSRQWDSSLQFDGELREEPDGLHYRGHAGADIKDIKWLLGHLQLDYPLDGALKVQGDVHGDFTRIEVQGLALSLDNGADFYAAANGELQYAFSGSGELDVVVNTELEDIESLMDVVDVDLSGFDAGKASLRLQGRFDDILITDIKLQTGNVDGLELGVLGGIRINDIDTDQLLTDEGVTITASAPGAVHLQHWTGDLGFETGPWQATATLLQIEDRLRITDIQLASDDGAGLTLRAQGAIADAGNIETGDFSSINGIDLAVEVGSATSGRLTRLFAAGMPELGAVAARARVRGDNKLLQIQGVEAALTSDGQYRIAASGGSADLYPGSNAILRNLGMTFSAALYSAESRDNVGELSGDLSISGIEPLKDLSLNLQLKQVSTSRLLQLTTQEFDYPGETGLLNGKLTLVGSADGLRLQNIDIRNTGNSQVSFGISGAINNLSDFSAIDLRVEGNVANRPLLRELSGVALAPWRGSVHITGSETDVNLSTQSYFGNTALTGRLKLALDKTGLTALSGTFSSPVLYLQDMGLSLGGEKSRPGQAAAAPVRQPAAKAKGKALPLGDLPKIPLDLRFSLGKIVGDNFKGEPLQVHLVAGDGLYELRQLALGHGGGKTRLQASLDTRSQLPVWVLKGSVLDLQTEALMRDLGIPSDVTGSFNTALDLSASGNTTESIVASLDGSVMLVLENTTIKGAAYDVLATETVAWFFTGSALEEKTVFTCIMSEFTLDHGRARSDELFIASDRMLAVGTADLDFHKMTVDVEITPRSRQRTFQIPGKVRVKGPVDNLRISSPALVTASNATTEVVTFVPRVAVKVLDTLFDPKKKQAEATPCQQLVEP